MVDEWTENHQHRHCSKNTHAVNPQLLEQLSVCSNYFTFSSISQAQNHISMKPRQQFGVGFFFGGFFVLFCCLFVKEKDTRKDGRLQYVVKEESSPLKRQQDFGQEILISKHVRIQTQSCNFVGDSTLHWFITLHLHVLDGLRSVGQR